jgi:orotate phosphoribosyltransferase
MSKGREKEVLKYFEEWGVVMDGHFVFSSGMHSDKRIDVRGAICKHRDRASHVTGLIAEHFCKDSYKIDTVIGPETGGAILATYIASKMNKLLNRVIIAVYAHKHKNGFALKLDDDKLMRNRNVLIVDDVLTTGRSVDKVRNLVNLAGGNTVGAGAVWNRGEVVKADIGYVPDLFSLVNIRLDSWTEDDCMIYGPCSKGIPVNTDYGHGQEFLELRKKVNPV